MLLLGIPPRSATATISITVLDINEEPPSFLSDSYSYTIAENNGISASLVTVEAEDPDLGSNGKITYSLNDTANFLLVLTIREIN